MVSVSFVPVRRPRISLFGGGFGFVFGEVEEPAEVGFEGVAKGDDIGIRIVGGGGGFEEADEELGLGVGEFGDGFAEKGAAKADVFGCGDFDFEGGDDGSGQLGLSLEFFVFGGGHGDVGLVC